MAVDPEDREIHLVYRLGDKLLYRVGDFDGRFGDPEEIFTSTSRGPKLWDPRIVLDANGTPHVTVSDGENGNRFTWYTNRIGGGWKPVTVVFDKVEDELHRTTMPSIVLEPDGSAAYVSTFTVGGPAKGEGNKWGILARLENLSGTPQVKAKRKIFPWNPELALVDGTLYVGGRHKGPGGDRNFILQEYDRESLEPVGEMYDFTQQYHGETARISVDSAGEIHVAGSFSWVEDTDVTGWYNTLSRVKAGHGPIIYQTSNANLNGAATPIRDQRADDRVYVLYWHGAQDDHLEPSECSEGNFLHYTRMENGEKEIEARKISERETSHGDSRRHTPPMAANPDGGMFVIFEECSAGGTLYFLRLGETKAASGAESLAQSDRKTPL